MKAFYFGCKSGPGHYFHDLTGRQSLEAEGNPWSYAVDGQLQPRGIKQQEGLAVVHHKDGWTALAFWDRSQDKRPGCCSVFLCDEIRDFAEMLDVMKLFPWKTFPFQVTELEPVEANA